MTLWRQIAEDLRCVAARDPAANSRLEILLTYPGVHAVIWYRIAHRLWRRGWRFSARLVSWFARVVTNVDIHPAAVIGLRFFIDHGAGVVIGETTQIGDDVTLYHGVTLGGTSWSPGKRHPTLEDNVIVGSGAQILGPITVGQRARVGANAVVTDDVPEGATMVGVKARSTLVKAETWAQDFIPYGTQCKEGGEPAGPRIEGLEAEVAALRATVQRLCAELGIVSPGGRDNGDERDKNQPADKETI